MFKKKLMFNVEDMEAIDFCRILGRHGLRFEITNLCSVARENDTTRKLNYRVFTVYATRRQAYALYEDLNVRREKFV